MKGYKKLLLFCAILPCLLFIGCKPSPTKFIEQRLVINNFTNAGGYQIEVNESFDKTNTSMIGEIVVQIGDDQSPTEYLQAYFFDSTEAAENYIKDEQVKNNYIIKQSGFASNGVSLTFGSYLNVVYISTSGALSILKR